jgi:hypothetical protein
MKFDLAEAAFGYVFCLLTVICLVLIFIVPWPFKWLFIAILPLPCAAVWDVIRGWGK